MIFGKTNTPEFGAKGVTESDAVGAGPQPVGPRPHARRLVGRVGRGGRGRHRARGRRQRRRRLDPDPGRLQRAGRPEDQPRHRPLRPADRRADVRHGHPGRALPHRARQRGAARRDHRAGSRRRLRGCAAAGPVRRGDPARPRARCGSGTPRRRRSTPTPTARRSLAVEAAATLLAELGHEVEEVTPPHDDEALARDFLTIWFAQLYGQVADARKRFGLAGQPLRGRHAGRRRARARGRDAAPDARRSATSTPTSARWRSSTRPTTYFLTPTLAHPAARGRRDRPRRTGCSGRRGWSPRCARGRLLAATGVLDDLISDNLSWVPYTQLANLTGRPAISVPLHWTDDRAAARACSSWAGSAPTATCCGWPPSSRRRSPGCSGTPTWTRRCRAEPTAQRRSRPSRCLKASTRSADCRTR